MRPSRRGRRRRPARSGSKRSIGPKPSCRGASRNNRSGKPPRRPWPPPTASAAEPLAGMGDGDEVGGWQEYLVARIFFERRWRRGQVRDPKGHGNDQELYLVPTNILANKYSCPSFHRRPSRTSRRLARMVSQDNSCGKAPVCAASAAATPAVSPMGTA
jgi:hypothetical protein